MQDAQLPRAEADPAAAERVREVVRLCQIAKSVAAAARMIGIRVVTLSSGQCCQ